MPNYDPQLVRWCNDDLRLPITVSTEGFERQFANGVLVASVLAKLTSSGLLPPLPDGAFDTLDNRQTTAAKLENFLTLRAVLADIGVPLSDKAIGDIATEQRGAAAILLLAIKAKVSTIPRSDRPCMFPPSRGAFSGTKAANTVVEADGAPIASERAYAQYLLASGLGRKQAAIELRLMSFEKARQERDRQVGLWRIRVVSTW